MQKDGGFISSSGAQLFSVRSSRLQEQGHEGHQFTGLQRWGVQPLLSWHAALTTPRRAISKMLDVEFQPFTVVSSTEL